MNVSGESVKGLALKYGVPLERLIVVSDDVALPVGRIRVRPSGSAGGQKGLHNVLECFKTNAIPRLRVGIMGETRRAGDDLSDYVLDRFSKAQRPLVEEPVVGGGQELTGFVTPRNVKALNHINRTPENIPTGTI